MTRKGLMTFICAVLTIWSIGARARTLVVYYSYTGNCDEIVTTLTSKVEADVVRIQPANKGQHYEANGYALGTQLLNTIKANPNSASSYPAIDPVSTSLSDYQNIIIVTPLWWSQMAAIMQTYLFNNSEQMAGKNVAMIVSSSSSGISGVVSDAKRLLPDVTWMGDALWINADDHDNRASLIENWLKTLKFKEEQTSMNKMYITIDGQTESITLANTKAAEELMDALENGNITVTLDDNDFEIWGALGRTLTQSDEQVNAQPGDIVLYSGSNICIFYSSNSYSYTRLGKIDGLTEQELRSFLKAGSSGISVLLSAGNPTAIRNIKGNSNGKDNDSACYSMSGQRVSTPANGLYIKNGNKIIL